MVQEPVKVEVTDGDIVDLLNVTLHELIYINARYAEGKFQMRVGLILAEITRDEVMDLRFDPTEFFNLVRDRLQEQVKPV